MEYGGKLIKLLAIAGEYLVKRRFYKKIKYKWSSPFFRFIRKHLTKKVIIMGSGALVAAGIIITTLLIFAGNVGAVDDKKTTVEAISITVDENYMKQYMNPLSEKMPEGEQLPENIPEEAPEEKPKAAEAKPKPPDLNKLVKEYEVKAKKYYNDYYYSSNHYEYTKEELKMLAIVIYLEARNQPFDCKIAVGNVVMNRVLASGYPGRTIEEVLTRKNQFCFNPKVTPNSDCMSMARWVLDYEVWTVPQSTYFFKVSSSGKDWGSHKYFKRYGNTSFYLHRYSGRHYGATIPERLFERVFKWPQYGCKPAKRVKKIQLMLRKLGYSMKADGYFGMDTKKALMKFQKSKKIKADGIAGPATIKALIRAYGINKYLSL